MCGGKRRNYGGEPSCFLSFFSFFHLPLEIQHVFFRHNFCESEVWKRRLCCCCCCCHFSSLLFTALYLFCFFRVFLCILFTRTPPKNAVTHGHTRTHSHTEAPKKYRYAALPTSTALPTKCRRSNKKNMFAEKHHTWFVEGYSQKIWQKQTGRYINTFKYIYILYI